MVTREDLVVKSLGLCRVDSPLLPLLAQRKRSYFNVDESDRALYDDTASALSERGSLEEVPGFEPAGPRRRIYFDPSKTRAGIVTCGGLCPGFNDVIRALVMELHFLYGVRQIFGFCNGYQGFIPKYKRPVIECTPQWASQINEHGGTVLGTSRGQQDPEEIVDCLERMGINVLFVIGGDGTLRGAQTICREVESRALKIAVVGIPKTIDNDILDLKYFDPSYIIRSVKANPFDAVYCLRLAHNAVHAAMAGRTDVMVSRWHGRFVLLPIALAVRDRHTVDPNGDLWMSVLESTGQSPVFK